MAYTAKDYSSLLGMEGLSETLLKNHFTLYQGYVTNTNKVLDALQGMLREGNTGTPEFAELKRRLGWEFNGMRLHEYYFENLAIGATAPAGSTNPGAAVGGQRTPATTGKGVRKEGKLADRLKEDFGSVEHWEKDFRGIGAMRGIGWAALYQDGSNGRLINFWINEHDVSHPAGCSLILVMDVFEHAFMPDYGLKKADYIEAFFKNINWEAAESRLS